MTESGMFVIFIKNPTMVLFCQHCVALHMTIQSPRSGCTMGQTEKIEDLGETKLTDSMGYLIEGP